MAKLQAPSVLGQQGHGTTIVLVFVMGILWLSVKGVFKTLKGITDASPITTKSLAGAGLASQSSTGTSSNSLGSLPQVPGTPSYIQYSPYQPKASQSGYSPVGGQTTSLTTFVSNLAQAGFGITFGGIGGPAFDALGGLGFDPFDPDGGG